MIFSVDLYIFVFCEGLLLERLIQFENMNSRETSNTELSMPMKSGLNPDTLKLYSIIQQEYSIMAE